MNTRKVRSFLVSPVLAAVLTAAVAAAPAASDQPAQPHPGSSLQAPPTRVPGPGNWEWWKDAEVQKQLGLTPEVVKRIDGHYRRRSEELRPVVERYRKEFDKLDAMTKAATADEATYELQLLQVEALRSRISQSRTMMLYRFFRELDPAQYKKLQEIFTQRQQRFMRGRGSSGR